MSIRKYMLCFLFTASSNGQDSAFSTRRYGFNSHSGKKLCKIDLVIVNGKNIELISANQSFNFISGGIAVIFAFVKNKISKSKKQMSQFLIKEKLVLFIKHWFLKLKGVGLCKF